MESKNGKHFASFAAADQPAGNTHTSKTSVRMASMKSAASSKKDDNKKASPKKSGEKPAKKKGFAYILSTICREYHHSCNGEKSKIAISKL